MFVSEIYGSTSSLLLPTQYLNNITYPACSQLSATTFGLSFTSALNHLTGASLTIDWGDGAQTSTVLAVGNKNFRPLWLDRHHTVVSLFRIYQ